MEGPSADIYRNATDKPIAVFLKDLDAALTGRGFLIHNREKMKVGETFAAHDVPVPEGFDVHMIQVCHPAKAGKSMGANPERAPLIPKFIVAFSRDEATQVRMLRYRESFAAALLDDDAFPASLAQSFESLTEAIEEAL